MDAESIWIYHERQEALLCGQHALNNLAQSPTAFTVSQLSNIAHQLDQLERRVMEPSAVYAPSSNVDAQGNFSIQVLKAALEQQYGIGLPHLSVALQTVKDITDIQGFLCHKSDHWFAIREIGGRYWNLNSFNERPISVSHFQLAKEMEQWQSQGYTIFGIPNGLPKGGTKLAATTNSGNWHRMSDLIVGKSTEKDPWEGLVGRGMRLDGGHRDNNTNAKTATTSGSSTNGFLSQEEEELQRALQASLLDASVQQQAQHFATLTVPEEPPAGTKGSCRLQIRLAQPHNQRLVRRFMESDQVKVIYAHVLQQVPDEQRKLELRFGFPPKDLQPYASQTIAEAKLAGESIQGRYV